MFKSIGHKILGINIKKDNEEKKEEESEEEKEEEKDENNNKHSPFSNSIKLDFKK